MRRIDPRILAAAGVALVLLLAALLLSRGREGNRGEQAGNANPAQAKPTDRCGSQRTYEEIKRELFRRAADTRGSNQAEFDRIAAHASVRVERPLLRDRDEELGTMRCSGRLSIDLPPGVMVVGGRRSLAADIDYVLQPASDGSGDVVMLEGADPIIIPLATLARSGEARTLPAVPPPVSQDTALQPPPTIVPAPPATQPPIRQPPASSARPSFNCRYARSRSEIAICGNDGLAALDRQMAAQYYRAVSAANARQRAQLVRSRDAFLRFRERCSSDACIAETYRGRMREIGDIMAGNWQPRR